MADYLLPAEALALLDAISGSESRGKYNIRYGGDHFSDYTDHPRKGETIKSGPNKGRVSTAAGRYQITKTTWDNVIQPALNLPDFSPESQDKAAWYLAQKDYGGDLLGDLRGGDPDTLSRISKKLAGTWTSLPSGIEQGTSVNRFRTAYTNALKTRMVSPEVPPPPNRSNALKAITDALNIEANPETTAYAPSSGSLTARALTEGAQAAPRISSAIAAALGAGKAFDIPSGSAADVPAVRAGSILSAAARNIDPIRARDPEIATIKAREPWSAIQEYNTLHPKRDVYRLPNGEVNLSAELADYVNNGYVPTNQRPRENGLTTRTVKAIPVTPDSPLAGNTSSLQAALDRIAERRRSLLNADPVVDPNGHAINSRVMREAAATRLANQMQTIAGSGGADTLSGKRPDMMGPKNFPSLVAGRPEYPGALPAAPPQEYLVGYSGSPVFGDNPGKGKPPTGLPGFDLASNEGMARWAQKKPTQPIVQLDAPQPMPRLYGRTPAPEEMTNPTAIEVLAGLKNGTIPNSPNALAPPSATSAFFNAVNSGPAQLVGQMNMGQRPLMSLLAGLFTGGGQQNSVNPNVVNAIGGNGLGATTYNGGNSWTDNRNGRSYDLSTYGYWSGDDTDPYTPGTQ